MALAHRRGFRSLISRKSASSYASLNGDDGTGKKSGSKKSKKGGSPKSVVTVRTVASTDDEASQGSDRAGIANKNEVIVCDGRPETKVSEDGSFRENSLESTRLMAVEMVRRSSTMTSMVAKTLASTSVVDELVGTDEGTKEGKDTAAGGENDAGQTGDAQPQGETGNTVLQQELGKRLDQALGCGNHLVETGKECVDSALEKTHRAANGLIESSAGLGRDLMASTEESTRAAIVVGDDNKPPLFPVLEKTGEKLEQTLGSVVSELREFLAGHWTVLRTTTGLFPRPGPGGTSDNVRPTDDKEDEDAVIVAIEVQMK